MKALYSFNDHWANQYHYFKWGHTQIWGSRLTSTIEYVRYSHVDKCTHVQSSQFHATRSTDPNILAAPCAITAHSPLWESCRSTPAAQTTTHMCNARWNIDHVPKFLPWPLSSRVQITCSGSQVTHHRWIKDGIPDESVTHHLASREVDSTCDTPADK